ncbi:MAG: hypothetical protein JWQ73_1391 [Variovorax sp.]|jgi:hypothetical protein|nr:hypothetical protein [Variovorax sp.]
MRVGKYIVTPRAIEADERVYVGAVELLWDEGDSTWETEVHFHRRFSIEAEALQHAVHEIRLRVADGRL